MDVTYKMHTQQGETTSYADTAIHNLELCPDNAYMRAVMNNGTGKIYDEVRQFIIDEFIYNPNLIARLKDETSLQDENILDSLGVHTLILYLENHFDITVLDEDATRDNFGSINSIVAYIQRKKSYQE